MSSSTWSQVASIISAATGVAFEARSVTDLGGGCINRAVRLADERRAYFVKVNDAGAGAMFEAERDGLDDLRAPEAVRVPAPVATGRADGMAFLAMEYISMRGLSGGGWSRLGTQLAALHLTTVPEFGWRRSNTIGSTTQVNEPTADWVEFWREHRLAYQLRLAARNGLDEATVQRGKRLMDNLDRLLAGHAPQPSLLHGDLWGGNVAADADGNPVLFDPAVYYGDREADIAMTELFGRLDERFYNAYQDAWPLGPGYAERKTLYNLYHVLNHFNLFGGGYAGQVDAMIRRLLRA